MDPNIFILDPSAVLPNSPSSKEAHYFYIENYSDVSSTQKTIYADKAILQSIYDTLGLDVSLEDVSSQFSKW